METSRIDFFGQVAVSFSRRYGPSWIFLSFFQVLGVKRPAKTIEMIVVSLQELLLGRLCRGFSTISVWLASDLRIEGISFQNIPTSYNNQNHILMWYKKDAPTHQKWKFKKTIKT